MILRFENFSSSFDKWLAVRLSTIIASPVFISGIKNTVLGKKSSIYFNPNNETTPLKILLHSAV